MGEFFQPQMSELPSTRPSPWANSDYFKKLMGGGTAPKAEFLGMPVTEDAMQQMQQSTSQYGPQLGEFYSQMMRGGGLSQSNQIMDTQSKIYQDMVDQIKANAGVLPRGSGQSRYLGQALGEATNQYNLQNQQTLLDQLNQSIANRFSGAQGLGAMPGYFSQPSSLESQMMNLRSQYDLSNQQAAQNQYALQASLLSQLLQPTNIDYQVMPSQFEQMFGWLGPLLGGVGTGIGQGIPTTL
jgi:hypothetical protein